MSEPELVSSGSCNAAAAAAADGGVGTEAASEEALARALDEHVRPQGTAVPVSFGSELAGLFWLDSILVMLSLGHVSLLRAPATVTAGCIAMVFLLAPRRCGEGGSGDGNTTAPVRIVAEQGAAAAVQAEPLTQAVTRGPVLPSMQAHWLALARDGLSLSIIAGLLGTLAVWAKQRRQAVSSALDAHGVPLALRDGENLVTGLLEVHPAPPLPKGQLAMARRGDAPSGWTVAGLAEAASVHLPASIDATALVKEVVLGHSPSAAAPPRPTASQVPLPISSSTSTWSTSLQAQTSASMQAAASLHPPPVVQATELFHDIPSALQSLPVLQATELAVVSEAPPATLPSPAAGTLSSLAQQPCWLTCTVY